MKNGEPEVVIYQLVKVGEEATIRSCRTSSMEEMDNDLEIMMKAVEFKYACRRSNKIMVVDLVKPWQALMLNFIGVRTIKR